MSDEKQSNVYQIFTEDEKLNYTFGTDGELEDRKNALKEYTPLRLVDYCIDKEGEIPFSFAQIQFAENPTEAAEQWYIEHCPNLTEEICGIIARSQFPEPQEKKEKADEAVFSITHGTQTISFD